jgi:hypothetical protein
MYAVWCEVSGGVTGPRAGWMKAVRTLLIAAAALAIDIVSAHADIESHLSKATRSCESPDLDLIRETFKDLPSQQCNNFRAGDTVTIHIASPADPASWESARLNVGGSIILRSKSIAHSLMKR